MQSHSLTKLHAVQCRAGAYANLRRNTADFPPFSEQVDEALGLGRATLAKIKQNLAWAGEAAAGAAGIARGC